MPSESSMERALPEPYGSGPGAGGWGASEPGLGLEGDAMARHLKAELEKGMPLIAKHHLEEITTLVRGYYIRRYIHSKNLKYGNLNKGFTEDEVRAFLLCIDDPEFKLLFEYMATLGFRIGEVVKLNVSQIDVHSREIRLRSEKSRKLDALVIPQKLFQNTLDYISTYRQEIEASGGQIFFANRKFSCRKDRWIEPNYVRKKFREYVVRAGLDEVYDISDEHESGRAVRRLHRLTTHSLRHFAITRFSKGTNGNLVLTSRFARHASPNTTMIYIHSDRKELYEAIERTDLTLGVQSATSTKIA